MGRAGDSGGQNLRDGEPPPHGLGGDGLLRLRDGEMGGRAGLELIATIAALSSLLGAPPRSNAAGLRGAGEVRLPRR